MFNVWGLSSSNGIRTHNHLLHTWTLNHLAKLYWVIVYELSKCGSKFSYIWEVFFQVENLFVQTDVKNSYFEKLCFLRNHKKFLRCVRKVGQIFFYIRLVKYKNTKKSHRFLFWGQKIIELFWVTLNIFQSFFIYCDRPDSFPLGKIYNKYYHSISIRYSVAVGFQTQFIV